jgi:hypothetical protein
MPLRSLRLNFRVANYPQTLQIIRKFCGYFAVILRINCKRKNQSIASEALTTFLRLAREAPPSLRVGVLVCEQMLLKKHDRLVELIIHIPLLAEAMSFVLRHQIPGLHLRIAQSLDHLL